jgi:hypothetical protein
MSSKVFADGLRPVRLTLLLLVLAGAALLILSERASLGLRISLEREALEEVRGGMGGQRWRDSAEWTRFEGERVQRIHALEKSKRGATWLLVPILLAAGYVARKLFRSEPETRSD